MAAASYSHWRCCRANARIRVWPAWWRSTSGPTNWGSSTKASTKPSRCGASTTAEAREWSQVELGQEVDARLGPVRLLAYRLSPPSAARCRAQVREKCRTYGRQPTAPALELAGRLILFTTVPAP